MANDEAVMKLFTAEKRPPSNAILAAVHTETGIDTTNIYTRLGVVYNGQGKVF